MRRAKTACRRTYHCSTLRAMCPGRSPIPCRMCLPDCGWADSVGAFLTDAGPGAQLYQFFVQPDPLQLGCQSWGTFGSFVADEKLWLSGYTAEYFAGQLLNLDWGQHGAGMHELY